MMCSFGDQLVEYVRLALSIQWFTRDYPLPAGRILRPGRTQDACPYRSRLFSRDEKRDNARRTGVVSRRAKK
jgi:hypothetical protein